MKYPKINHKEPTKEQKRLFRVFKKAISGSVEFDNKENGLSLTKKDIELLAWNAATRLIS
jgi:hypothetical protein